MTGKKNTNAGSPTWSLNDYLEGERSKQSKRLWMWVAVASLSVAILVLWGWSLRLQMAFFEWRSTPEGQLVKQTKVEWDKAFADGQDEKLQLEQTKRDVKNTLSAIVAQSATATTSASSTSSTPTTTLPTSKAKKK